MLGTRVRIPVGPDSDHPMHVWEGKRLLSVIVMVHKDFFYLKIFLKKGHLLYKGESSIGGHSWQQSSPKVIGGLSWKWSLSLVTLYKKVLKGEWASYSIIEFHWWSILAMKFSKGHWGSVMARKFSKGHWGLSWQWSSPKVMARKFSKGHWGLSWQGSSPKVSGGLSWQGSSPNVIGGLSWQGSTPKVIGGLSWQGSSPKVIGGFPNVIGV